MRHEDIVRLDWDIAGMTRNALFHFSRILGEKQLEKGCHQFFCDGETWDFFINERTISGEISDIHSLHEELGLIPLTVTIEIADEKPRMTSGFHEYDYKNDEHPGIVIVNHVENFAQMCKKEIIKRSLSATSHEVYHSARWFFNQVEGTQDLSLYDHISNREETGARIQEAFTIMPANKNPSCPSDFKLCLEDILGYYLIRNKITKGSEEYNDLMSRMTESHMAAYRKCLGLF